ncbi:MAG: hypothetical protein AB7F40_12230 [Victivallaceae bacterium]
MSMNAEVNGVKQFSADIRKIAEDLNRSSKDVMRQLAGFFAVSAARLTPPRASAAGTAFKKLARRFRIAPVVKTPGVEKWLYRYSPTGSTFLAARKIKNPESRNLELVSKRYSIKRWDKKRGAWKYLPFSEEKPASKYPEGDRRARIPAYGAVKLGWLAAGRAVRSAQAAAETPTWDRGGKGDGSIAFGFSEVMATMTNRVGYAAIIGQPAVVEAQSKAANRLNAVYERELAKIERKNQKRLS